MNPSSSRFAASSFHGRGTHSGQDRETDDGEKYATHDHPSLGSLPFGKVAAAAVGIAAPDQRNTTLDDAAAAGARDLHAHIIARSGAGATSPPVTAGFRHDGRAKPRQASGGDATKVVAQPLTWRGQRLAS